MNLERAEQLAFEKMELHGLGGWGSLGLMLIPHMVTVIQ